MVRRLLLTLAMLASMALVALGPPQANAATWGADVRLVFSRGGDIWIAHPDGSHLTNLTNSAATETSPTLSRTGRYVAYTVAAGSTVTIWVYDAQTGKHSSLVQGVAPDFSPTDDVVAFHRYEAGDPGTFNIYSINLDGTGLKNWVTGTDISLSPQWASDGQSLLYSGSEGARSCRVDMGGYDDIHYAYRLRRVSAGGARSVAAGDDTIRISGGQEAGGVLAYTKVPLPPTAGSGYCASTPPTDYHVVVNGAEGGSAQTGTVSVSAGGDVAYADTGGQIVVDPAGAEGAATLFEGSGPDWGVVGAAPPPPPTDDCTIKGTEGKDKLVGTAGADVICGFGENDVLLGNGGNDVLRGGDGEDDLAGGPGVDTLDGGEDDDALRGDEGNDVLGGGPGKDLVTYFTSKDKVTLDLAKQTAKAGSHGNDTLKEVEGAFGSKTGDLLLGSSGSNHLFGGPGKDVIKGGGGTDVLYGSAGDDVLDGGGGGDLLEGTEGKDTLDGGPARDACYDEKNTKRKSCEEGKEKEPKAGKPPKKGPDTGEMGRPAQRVGTLVAKRAGAWYWDLGKHDYLVVYSLATTQALGSWANTSGWENKACYFIRYTPARGACSAVGVLNAVSKYQMQWFLWNAKTNGGCAIGILDWGHHGVNQFANRWKTRAATSYTYRTYIPWVTAGRYSDVKTSNGGYVRVYCY